MNISNRFTFILLSVIAMTLFMGCPEMGKVRVFNATERSFEFRTETQRKTIASQKSKDFMMPLDGFLTITDGEMDYRYIIVYPGKMARRTNGRLFPAVQLCDDMKIFVIDADSTEIPEVIPEQPLGYPFPLSPFEIVPHSPQEG